jgi:CHAD domain-containing protein
MLDYARLQTAILLRRLAFQLNRSAKSRDPDSIHDLRVAIRRLNRCLRVFSQFYPGHSWKNCRRQLSDLLQAAGKVRDRDIAIEMLEKAGVPGRAAIVARLKAERQKTGRELLEEIRRWNKRGFSRKWRAALEL